jgi:hypothetical protein
MNTAVEEMTARLAPRSASHFVFSKLTCPSERTSPTTPKILNIGRRNSAVTTQEKVVSCGNEATRDGGLNEGGGVLVNEDGMGF